MKVNIKDVENGKLNGEYVYVSDIRHNGKPFDKLLRNVRPEKVLIVPTEEVANYGNTKSVFRALKKNGEPAAHWLNLYDNTRFGIALNVFSTLQEAEKSYTNQRYKIIKDMLTEMKKLNNLFEIFQEETIQTIVFDSLAMTTET